MRVSSPHWRWHRLQLHLDDKDPGKNPSSDYGNVEELHELGLTSLRMIVSGINQAAVSECSQPEIKLSIFIH